jgi:hypothetical protein
MQQPFFKPALLITIFTLFTLVSCDTSDPFEIPPPDFSTVPDAYDISGLEGVEVEEGITAYIHDEGEEGISVTIRDDVQIFITLRTLEGDIIFSTYNDARVDPILIRMSDIRLVSNVFRYNVQLAYTYGLRQGLLGMQEGEKRTLIVEPEQGFADLPEGAANAEYKESTLQYDIILSRILD